MGNRKRDWQDTDYVLNYFGKRRYHACRHYEAFVAEGLHQGRREDLVGGGLIRSLGGWSAVTAKCLKGTFIKSDERILGDGDFVEEILSEAAETFERKYAMKRRGYDLDKIAKRAAAVCAVVANDIFFRSKQPARVKARSLFCYWASSELGISYTELSRRLGISAPGVGYSAERGKIIAEENGYQLLE